VTVKLPGPQAGLLTPSGVGAASGCLRLFGHAVAPCAAPATKRRRLWQLSGSLHCSIIGTCLTTCELRQILRKIQPSQSDSETDHQLHGRAVVLAAQQGPGSKLLQKSLDRRHRSAIRLFAKASNAEALRAHWNAAQERGEIPGAYWAVLTHPEATEGLLRQVFGEVHMLSHLVGAANRADIRRLRDLEADNSALQEKVRRQQRQLRDAVVARDESIARLHELLAKAMTSQPPQVGGDEPASAAASETTAHLLADLRRQLELERTARNKSERRLQDLNARFETERRRLRLLEEEDRTLREELELAELSLTERLSDLHTARAPSPTLPGTTLLYVGGRAHQIAQLRALAEQAGGSFLHHDGGIDDRSGLLEAQVARADLVFFPVDCVSHNAVTTIKRVSRQVGNFYVALRSSGLTSFAAALRTVAQQRHGEWVLPRQ